MRIGNNETLEVLGTTDVSSGTLTMAPGQVLKTYIEESSLASFPLALTELRVWDDLALLLPGTAATDDLGIIEGTWGAEAPTVQSADAKATTVTQYARFRIAVPQSYKDGQDIKLRLSAGMITTVANGTATVNVECYKDDESGGVSANLCTTGEQSINNLAKADKDFIITATSVVTGDVLDFRITVAITDAATGTAVIGEISRIEPLFDVRG